MPHFEAHLSSPSEPRSISSPSPKQEKDPYLTSYLEETEAFFSPAESAAVDQVLQQGMYDEMGKLRPYHDITKDLFHLAQDQQFTDVTLRLKKELHRHLRDYLVTKVDRLLYEQAHASDPEHSGVFRLVEDTEDATLTMAHTDKKKSVRRAESRLRTVSASERRPISRMNLEALLSKRKIGTIDRPMRGQFNYGFFLPEDTGMVGVQPEANPFSNVRHTDPLTEDEMQPNDIFIELPQERVHDGIVPVPAGYHIAGSPDQALKLIDPNIDNPFCTRLADVILGDTLTYVIRPNTQSSLIQADSYLPDEEEKNEIAQALPFPLTTEGKDLTRLIIAKRAVAELLSKQFLYCCDNRIGEFIARHSEELSTIVDGLRFGHCDLLAWTAARYLRQMGHAACVVSTEISEGNGTGFARDMTHSRVGIIQASGVVSYFDPTSCCQTIRGYALSHIDDQTIAELEEAFDGAKTREDKMRLLQDFRALVDEREDLTVHEESAQDSSVPELNDSTSELSDINISAEEVTNYMHALVSFAPSPLSQSARLEVCRLADLLNELHLPLSMDCLKDLKYRQLGLEASRKTRLRITSLHDALHVLCGEKSYGKYFPDLLSDIYTSLDSSVERGADQAGFLKPGSLQDAVAAFPDPANLMGFADSFSPHQTLPDNEPQTIAKHIEQVCLAKLAACAFVDEEPRAFLLQQFRISAVDLLKFSEQVEPSLAIDSLSRTVTDNLQAFTGKRTAEDYASFLARAKRLDDELCTLEAERRVAAAQFLHFLASMPLQADRSSESPQERDPFDTVEAKYRPGEHPLEAIDQYTSAKRDTLTVKVERRFAQPSKSLYVNIDTATVDNATSHTIFSHFARMQTIIQSLLQYSRLRKITVYISSSNNDYFKITPNTRTPPSVLVMRLLFMRADKPREAVYGFRTKHGLPKNLLYLSCSQGKVNAVKYNLGKKTNVIAKNFTELGLDIFPRLKVEDEALG